MRHPLKLIIALWATLWPTVAATHHVVSESGIAWVEPVTVVEVEAEGRDFSVGEQRGVALVVAPSAQWQLHERLALTMRLPMAFVRFEDGRKAAGSGDVELGARVALYASAHGGLIVSAGVALEAPTGSARDALGGGHWALAPYMTASAQLSTSWLIYGVTSYGHALPWGVDEDALRGREDDRAVHGAPFAPHASRELMGRLMAAYVHHERLYGAFGAQWELPVWPYARGPLVGRAELGVVLRPGVRLALGADTTLAGPARFGARGRASLAWQW